MKKTYVSDEVKTRIINLRKSDASWLNIQKATDVPRRTAKRIFEEWQGSQVLEVLVSARKQVAVELFNQHIQDLTNIAQILLDKFETPPELSDVRDSAGILNNIFETGILIHGQEPTFSPSTPSNSEQVYRKNKMLYESLRQHLKEGSNRSAIDEWLSSRDKWKENLGKLRLAINELVSNIIELKIQSWQSEQKIAIDSTLVNKIELGITAVVYRAIAEKTTDLEKIKTYIQKSPLTDPIVVIFSGSNSTTELIVGSEELAEIVIEICTWALENLLRGKESDATQLLAKTLDNMQKYKDQLDERLNALRLVPVILHTKCELCPA